ncbi:Pls/PosA family non-ribosomal peptide synthetase [Streptomyces sp. NPDC047108]|uniref:Pls/PosA family non-ribosomal peptide synthetase n=1 Tax=Streptomyces sp. NPDC047108 TaxID=3155025 RepID=UPI00340B7AE2
MRRRDTDGTDDADHRRGMSTEARHARTRDGRDISPEGPPEHRPPGPVLIASGREQTIRWRPGERLEHLFETRCDLLRTPPVGTRPPTTGRPQTTGRPPTDERTAADERTATGGGPATTGRPAVDEGNSVLTYDQLDARANQLARHLLARGVRPGDRVGLLFARGVHAYVGMLAVLKAGAVYVPLDAAFPSDRLAYIVRDAGVRTVLSHSLLRDRLEHTGAAVLCVDEAAPLLAAEDPRRLLPGERGDPPDDLCYIIYTSGSTGRPKGVAITHAGICNFVRVAGEVYGLRPDDRVYQGMTIAFDFSVEEIWVPLMAGATLVPRPPGSPLVGRDLWEFLDTRSVTALCCVPTLLATLEAELPSLRFLLVSGEACPQDLVTRWHRPGRRFLNVYGPTEATVTATWTPVHPDRPVTIGVPLPTYSAVILDPTAQRAMKPGEMGEIGIAGVGLARGYVNRDDLTDRAFVEDFLRIGNNPSGRIYRTGDLGRVNDDGEIEYHGRIDTQVKIRGYRIELSEIESVLLQVPRIAQAAVATHESAPGLVELVAYYSPHRYAERPDPDRVRQELRARLPGYMVPAYLEEMTALPVLPSGKIDRKHLPPPSGPRSPATRPYTPPATGTEAVLAGLLAGALGLERVSADSHFFDDLGANSLLMARFCARVRNRPGLPPVSMRDIYLHPTIAGLATALAEAPRAPESAPVTTAPAEQLPGTPRYALCGALQLLLFLGYVYCGSLLLIEGYRWVSDGSGLLDDYVRSTVFGVATFLALAAVPVVAKWMLIGRWRPCEVRLWSLTYLRFWTVKTLVGLSPMLLFAGSPLYVLYLRALGARIGRGTVIFTRSVPVCTDLLTVGENTVIRKNALLNCYRAEAGRLRTGRVTLGDDVLVSEHTVLDIEVTMGDGGQLGHASSLHAGQTVPAGEAWAGSPAQRTGTDFRAVEPVRCGTVRRALYAAAQLLTVPLLYVPVALGALGALLPQVLTTDQPILTSPAFYRDQILASLVLFFGPLLAGLAFVVAVPRLLNVVLRPDRVYPLYGFHYSVQRTIARISNMSAFMGLFGDSAFIVHYLRSIGWDLSRVVQTGSNFGVAQQHETPFLAVVGSGTMVSDGLSVINADFSSTSFRVTRTAVGPRNFLGNDVAYPSRGRTGANCLLGTKVMVPVDGEVREGVGLLGSPCFEIPRSVQRDSRFDRLKSREELPRHLAAKRRHNTATIGLFLLVMWIEFFVLLLLAVLAAEHYTAIGALAVSAAALLGTAFTIAFSTLAERAVLGFRSLRPRFCSIYDPQFWRHERMWKLSMVPLFNGTPFKPLLWRLAGVRMGRKVFDDGCGIPEKTLVTIGDGCALNMESTIQCHSLEDGTFKTDRITIGDGCTLAPGAFVHYGVTMGDGATLGPDSFLMKGEEIPPGARWRGNPAREAGPVPGR